MKSSRPQITILVANLPAERDRRVIRESLSLEAAGYDVTVIAPRGDVSLKTLPGSRSVRLKPYPIIVSGGGVLSFAAEFVWSFTCVAIRLLGEVLSGRAHAVQVCNPPDVYWPLALLLRALGRPWVFDHHDLCPEIYVTRTGGSPNPLVLRMLVACEWLTLRTATAVIATNESFRENALGRGVRPEKLTVVRNGPSTDEVEPETPTTPAGQADLIVYLGVLGPQDNVEGAVLAAEDLARRRGRGGWRMVIAGDGECMPALTKLVAERGLGDVVEFTGWLGAAEVDALLRSATIAIQPDLPTRMNHLSTMAKSVELLKSMLPGLTRLGVVVDPATPSHTPTLQSVEASGRTLGLRVHVARVKGVQEFDEAFAALAHERVNAVLVLSTPLFMGGAGRLAELGLSHKLPTMFGAREHVAAGGLAAYSPDRADLYRRGASYVDKIFKGANAANLPVQQATKFDFVVNLKTARALGLTIPTAVLTRADEIIE